MSTDIFGQINLVSDLEQAVVDTLQAWWPVYKKEIELQHAADWPVDMIPDIKGWLISNQMDQEQGYQFPSVVVVSPGMDSRNQPRQEGDGSIRSFWNIGIGIFAAADQRQSTMNLVRVYTAIMRAIMLQKQSLGGFADGTTWLDESYDDNFPFTDGQTISAGQLIFTVELSGIINRFNGPAVPFGPPPPPDPINQPGSDWPTITKVTATVGTK